MVAYDDAVPEETNARIEMSSSQGDNSGSQSKSVSSNKPQQGGKNARQTEEHIEGKPILPHAKGQSSYVPPGPRRSSSRSIKRPKFDDELVDTSALKRTSSLRKSSESSPSDLQRSSKKSVVKQASHQTTKKKTKKIKPVPVPTDFGRWRPTDDLALISAVTQTCDLQTVHLAVRFSCRFTLKEIQDRWFALLYDPFVSRLAQQSMKALPSDVIEQILNNALWSRDEDCIIADIDIESNPSFDDFQNILNDKIHIFHKSRTASTLQDHWQLLRHYNLLSCQHVKNTTPSTPTTLAEMENKMVDDQIDRMEDETLNQELAVSDRRCKREIKRLEKEIPHWEMLIENSGHVDPRFKTSDFSEGALAVLKGRILKYSITKSQVVIGRNCYDCDVDIDLSIEGPSLKISRQQGIILYEEGVFYLENCGKRTFYINGFPLATGQSARLVNDTMIEICCIKLLFLINNQVPVQGDEDGDNSDSAEEHSAHTKVKDKLKSVVKN